MTITDLALALGHRNVSAFLRAIRLAEGTNDALGYRRLVGGGEFPAPPWRHPNKRVYLPRYFTFSTAAGAYQFLHRTWAGLVAEYGFTDFSPANQDMAAVALIAGRGALEDVLGGRIEEAIEKCKLEWAGLPGSPHGQRTEELDKVLAEYTSHGGVIV